MGRELSHVDSRGRMRMVDVSRKPDTLREAVARGRVTLRRRTLSLISRGKMPKGDVFSAARIAGIMAAKGVDRLIPLCHPLCISHASVDFVCSASGLRGRIDIRARVTAEGKTGVEMESLAAVAVAALTVYDMCKAVDDSIAIGSIRLVRKSKRSLSGRTP